MNMMECISRGHEIVALANLHPQAGEEELDSYMYQSVGFDAIEAYAECLQLPLYRRCIAGKPVNQAYEYEPTAQDEVEDLYELLVEVQKKHPDIEAVSSGAIFSTYQKNRVENICARLGWTSLAFLWEREQKALLKDMIDQGIKAIVLKTAVYGLDKSDLARPIDDAFFEKLVSLESNLGLNVCGEGGEYESLVLDCPLFKSSRLEISEYDVITHKDSAFAPVAFIKIKGLRVLPK